jgi:hypothetical protein
LEKEGLVIRRRVDNKINNFWKSTNVSVRSIEPLNAAKPLNKQNKQELWYWEGNVQATVIKALKLAGYHINSLADTASHQHGIDIMAEKDGKHLWVSVKGYPWRTGNTQPSTQAGHYFKEVIFDMIEYRQRNGDVSLAVALPDFPRYRSLSQQISWLKPVAKFSYYWVKENGDVVIR